MIFISCLTWKYITCTYCVMCVTVGLMTIMKTCEQFAVHGMDWSGELLYV